MRKAFLFFIFVISFVSFVSAVNIEINQNVSLGENVLMKVSGNFLENIQKSDVSFYRRHMSSAFTNYDVKKIGEDFYIYVTVDLNKIPDNYSIQIRGINHMEGAELTRDTIIGNFTILNTTADFSLVPGIIQTENNFSVKVQNLNKDYLPINVEDTQNNEYTLKSGEIKTIYFMLGDGTRTIKFSSANQTYNLIVDNPILIEEKIDPNVPLNNSEINKTIIIDENITETDNNKVIINENKSESNNTQNETKDPSEVLVQDPETGEVRSCADLNGSICKVTTEKCDGNKEVSASGECCLGRCIEKSKNNSKKIVGWVLIGIIAIIFLWFFLKKYKGTKKKKVNLEKESKGRNLPGLPSPPSDLPKHP